MRVRAGRAAAGVFVAVAAAAAGADAGCSLGLDASLIDASPPGDDVAPVPEAGADAPAPVDADAHPAPTDGPPSVDAGACSKDSDCATAAAPAGACVTASKCDPTWHVCMLTTCPTQACHAAVCNLASQQCSVPTSYGFEATKFTVGYGGVGAGVRYSIAAAWPFVFVLTTNGVVAYDVVDPSDASPPLVAVHGVPFLPIAVVAVGRRVYFVRGTEGTGPSYREAVAWLDVPQNPLLTTLTAQSAFVTTPADGVDAVLTNGVDGLFVAYAGNLEPTAKLVPPIDDTTVLKPVANAGLASGASLWASSGSRLLAYRYDPGSNNPFLAIVNAAATPGAQTTTEVQLDAYGPLADQRFFATGDDGSVLWSTAV